MKVQMNKISTHLWFDTQAEEAVQLYTTIFKNSHIGRVTHYGHAGYEHHGMPAGSVMTVAFQLEGQDFVAMNAGPQFQFTEAISFMVRCETQAEIDHYWDGLSEGGDERAQVCGWLKDRFGVSWQVVPAQLDEMLNGPDRDKADRVMQAVLTMKKIDLAMLQNVYEA